MNALHGFLFFWNWFTTTHTCQTLAAGSPGPGVGGVVNGQTVYGGNCIDALAYGQHLHSFVTWVGSSQGWVKF